MAGVALGAGPAAAEEPEPDVEVRYKDKTVVDFTELTVTGALERPQNDYVLVRRETQFRSLVRLRGGFLSELTRSLDAL